jgi:hypothetical protein
VCNINNECEQRDEPIIFSFSYQDERNDKWQIINLKAVIGRTNGIADMVIGRYAIKANKLYKRIPSHFKVVSARHGDKLKSRPLIFPPRNIESENNSSRETKISPTSTPPTVAGASCACSAHSLGPQLGTEQHRVPIDENLWEHCKCPGGPQQDEHNKEEPFCSMCTLIVSKSQLLDGIEDDDDIELPEFPLGLNNISFDDLDILDIGEGFQPYSEKM